MRAACKKGDATRPGDIEDGCTESRHLIDTLEKAVKRPAQSIVALSLLPNVSLCNPATEKEKKLLYSPLRPPFPGGQAAQLMDIIRIPSEVAQWMVGRGRLTVSVEAVSACTRAQPHYITPSILSIPSIYS